MLLRGGRAIAMVVDVQVLEVKRRVRDLAKAYVADVPRKAQTGDFPLNHLAQVRLLVTHEDVLGADVTDHAGNADIRGRRQRVCHEHVQKLALSVGTPAPSLVLADEPRARESKLDPKPKSKAKSKSRSKPRGSRSASKRADGMPQDMSELLTMLTEVFGDGVEASVEKPQDSAGE